jgi:hypothetical protein
VYLYNSFGSLWSRQSKFLARDGTSYDYFGIAISVYSTTAMLASSYNDGQLTNGGIESTWKNTIYSLHFY